MPTGPSRHTGPAPRAKPHYSGNVGRAAPRDSQALAPSRGHKDRSVLCAKQAFAREGAKVVAIDINAAKLQELEAHPGE